MKTRRQTMAERLGAGVCRWLLFGLLGTVCLLICETQGASRNNSRSQRTPASKPSASTASSTNLSGLAAFNLISERNIFNPNRGSRSSEAATERPAPKVVKIETASLVGTLIHGNGMIAFFDGSSSSFKKAVKPTDTIAGWKVKAVGPDAVWLESGGKEVEMKVGMAMRRQDEGEWKFSSGAEVKSASDAGSSSSGKSPGEDSGGSGSSDEDEVVRKMMERRAKENK